MNYEHQVTTTIHRLLQGHKVLLTEQGLQNLLESPEGRSELARDLYTDMVLIPTGKGPDSGYLVWFRI